VGKFAILILLGLSTEIFGAGAFADAANWMIRPSAQTNLSASATLTVGVPADLSPAEIAHLGVEVDNIDVTALVHIGKGTLVYNPPQPLEEGQHELRVVEYANDGHMISRGSWIFTIKSSAKTASSSQVWSVKGSVGASASERLAQSNLTPPAPSPFALNGTFDVKVAGPLAEWTAEASVNGLYGSNNGTSTTGQAVQPAQMQVALKRGKDSLILGDQTLPYNNLLISGLSRRGISAQVAGMPLDSEAGAFSLRDSSLAGFYGGLGFTDSNDNVSGAALQSHLFPNSPQALTLLAGYVSGTAPAGLSFIVPYPGGNNSLPPSIPGSVVPVQSGAGSAWVVSLDSQIPGSTLHLNGQYAGSTFNFPGVPGQSATSAADHASSLSLNYSRPLGEQAALSTNAIYQNVGTFFRSLANPALSPDQRMATASGTLSGHGLQLAASGGFSEDNTDSNPAIATVRTLPRSVTAGYGPTLPVTVTAWLGAPSLSLAWQDARTYNVTQPAGAQLTDSSIVNNNATLSFAYTHWTWQAGLTTGSFRDHTGQQDNTDNLGPTLGLNVTLGNTGSAGLNVQLVNTHDLKQDTHTRDRNYALTVGDSLLSGKLSAQLTLAINHNTQQIVPGMIPPQLVGNNVVLKTATAQLTWHAIQATPRRGGLDVGLSSSWNDSSGFNTAALTTQGFSSLATRGYQVFLTLSTTWPIGTEGH